MKLFDDEDIKDGLPRILLVGIASLIAAFAVLCFAAWVAVKIKTLLGN